MLAVGTRSGLIETFHDGALAVYDAKQNLVAWAGDIDRTFFLRSSAKPFQAVVSQEAGAGLSMTELAVATASHDGFPVHISIVRTILQSAGLSETDLMCPESWPLGRGATQDLNLAGHRSRRRIWNNCSGKHAAWLRACLARGWPLDSYLDPGHPLQERVRTLVAEAGEFQVEPVGIDGCGAPVLRTTVRAMALMFARFATESRFAEVYRAMHTYPALVSGVGNGDAVIATSLNAAAKRGAAGCIGIAVQNQFGVAAKSWDGNDTVAAMAAATGLGMVSPYPTAVERSIARIIHPPVHGGGEVVGSLESVLELTRA